MNNYPGQRGSTAPRMQPNPNYERRQDQNQSQNNPNRLRTSTVNPSVISRPGAYCINRNETAAPELFRVRIPRNVGPNQEFQVYAGSRMVRVRCPPNGKFDEIKWNGMGLLL